MKKRFSFGLSVLLIGLLFSLFLSTKAEAATNDMYRLYNPNSGEHFYTANTHERDLLKRVGWSDEGIGWYAPTSGDPVYRVYNPNAGDHHYTPHKSERDHLVKVGWRNEGVGWYSDKNKTIPLYRAYNPNARAGSHNYTISKAEQNHLIKVGWKNENIAWYGAKKSSVPKVNKTELQALYNKVKGTGKENYTDTTWNVFQNALSHAKSVLVNGKVTQAQVTSAKDALQKAFDGLKKEPEVKSFSAVAGDNGSITGTANGTYADGTQISVTATPDPGYKFKTWTTTTGLPAGTNTDSATVSFNMPANAVTLVAEFEEIHTFSATAGDNGSITGTENGDYSEGTKISVTATPDPGYKFKTWTTTTGLPAGTNTDSATVSFNMPANAVTLVAEFEVAVVYQIGDYYPDPSDSTTAIGKVFEVSKGGIEGKIVNTEASPGLSWGPSNAGTEATNETDGLSNMAVITSQLDWKNTYPLFAWVDGKNPEGTTYSSGRTGIWYVPAKQELQAIRDSGIWFSKNTWSSTDNVSNITQAWSYEPFTARMVGNDKGWQYPTYAVSAFN